MQRAAPAFQRAPSKIPHTPHSKSRRYSPPALEFLKALFDALSRKEAVIPKSALESEWVPPAWKRLVRDDVVLDWHGWLGTWLILAQDAHEAIHCLRLCGYRPELLCDVGASAFLTSPKASQRHVFTFAVPASLEHTHVLFSFDSGRR